MPIPFVFELENLCEEESCDINKMFKLHLDLNDVINSRNVLYFLPGHCTRHFYDFRRLFQVAFCNELVLQHFSLTVTDLNTFYFYADNMSFGELQITRIENLLSNPRIVTDKYAHSSAPLRIECKNNVKKIEFREINYMNRKKARTITINIHQYLEEIHRNITFPKLIKRCIIRTIPEYNYLRSGSDYCISRMKLRPVIHYNSKTITFEDRDEYHNFHMLYDPWNFHFEFDYYTPD